MCQLRYTWWYNIVYTSDESVYTYLVGDDLTGDRINNIYIYIYIYVYIYIYITVNKTIHRKVNIIENDTD